MPTNPASSPLPSRLHTAALSSYRRRPMLDGKMKMAVAAAALWALAPRAARAGEDLGFVLEQVGKWQISSDGGEARPVAAGQTVKAGDRLTPVPAAPDSRLTVVLLDGDRLGCPTDPRCAAPLKGKAAAPGVGSRIVRAVSGLFSKPERYATTMSRGDELAEATLKLRGDKTDIAPLLEKLPAGRYHLAWTRLTDEGADSASPTWSDVTWQPGKPRPFASRGLRPGIYRVALESGADAWVLLSPEKKFAADSAAFAEAVKVVDGWGKDVPARAARSFLRATLESQARGPSAEGK